MPSPLSARRSTVVLAWFVAGTADIVVAVTYYPLTGASTPIGILHYVASGLIGAAAFTGGYATAALGLACHYTIALIWTLVFFFAYPRMPFLARSVPLTAVLYGTFVSAVMNFGVLSLSRVAPRTLHVSALIVATVILWFTIGLPLALFARRAPARWSGR
jgi:hypothetical protein